MATVGLRGDVNNSIFLQGAYPGGRDYGMVPAAATDFSMRNNYAGELGGLNQDYARSRVMRPAGAPAGGPSTGVGQIPASSMRNGNGNGAGKQPAMWFLTFAVIFIIVAWAARKFAPEGESFAIIRPNLINGVFLTLWIVLILVFLKQVAIRVKSIPGVSALADMVLAA
jgi:hypothetical protein